MNKFYKGFQVIRHHIAVPAALGAALILAACGGGSSGGGGDSSPPAGGSSSISGSAAKGIIIDGLVSAYLIVNGVEETTAIATAMTDENGDYTLDMGSDYDGEPFVVRITADADTTMACDIAGGCTDSAGDTVAFGEPYALDPASFGLSALVSEVDDASSVYVGVTPLSTVSTSLGLEAISNLGTASDFNVRQAVENANSQVAQRFGFSGSVTDIEIVDLTDPQDVADVLDSGAPATADPVQFAAINAAIISAVQSDEGSGMLSVEDAIEDFADAFVASGLPENSLDDSLTDLEDILEDALDVLMEVETDLADAGLDDAVDDLEQIQTDVENEEMMAQDETPSDEGDQGTPSETAGEAELAQVKAMVAQLRDLGTVIEMSSVGSGEAATTIGEALDNFEIQAEAAELLTSDDIEAALDVMGQAIEAVLYVYDRNFDLATGELLPVEEQAPIASLPGSDTYEGVQVNVSQQEGATLLTVEQVIVGGDLQTDVNVDLTFTLNSLAASDVCTVDDEVEIDLGEFVWRETVDDCEFGVDFDLDMAGQASTANVMLAIAEGSSTTGTAGVDYEKTVDASSNGSVDTIVINWLDDFDLTNLDFALNLTLDQLLVQDPMSFEGHLNFSLSNFQALIDEDETIVIDDGFWLGSDYSYSEVFDLGTFDFEVGGTFANASNEFSLSLDLALDGVGVDYTDVFDTANPVAAQSELVETASEYIEASLDITFEADLAGLSPESDDATISLSIERTALSAAMGTLELTYPGSMFSVSASAEGLEDDEDLSATLVIENQDGVIADVMILDPVVGEDSSSGIIRVGDTTYADIVPLNDEDALLVEYVDGFFETIY